MDQRIKNDDSIVGTTEADGRKESSKNLPSEASLSDSEDLSQKRDWPGIAVAILGIAFVLTDVLSDMVLGAEYLKDAPFYAKYGNRNSSTFRGPYRRMVESDVLWWNNTWWKSRYRNEGVNGGRTRLWDTQALEWQSMEWFGGHVMWIEDNDLSNASWRSYDWEKDTHWEGVKLLNGTYWWYMESNGSWWRHTWINDIWERYGDSATSLRLLHDQRLHIFEWQMWKSFNISDECIDIELCVDTVYNTSSAKTDQCKEQIRENLLFDPPKHLLGSEKECHIYGWLTIGFVVLGGILQTLIAGGLAIFGNKTFASLPKIVQILTFPACLLMVGPVVVNFYLLLLCARGITEEEKERYKIMIGTLKLGEILFESIPQLLLNAITLMLRCDQRRQDILYTHLPLVKGLSIVTSILGIAYGTTIWLTKKRRDFFVSQQHHPWASFFGAFIWALLGLFGIFTAIVNVSVALEESNDRGVHLFGLGIDRSIRLVAMCLIVIPFVFVFTTSCSGKSVCRYFKMFLSAFYLINLPIWIGIFARMYYVVPYLPLAVTIGFFCAHFLLGLLILISPVIGATVFEPFVRLLFFLLRKITCGKLEEKIKCWESWERMDKEANTTQAVDKTELVDVVGRESMPTEKKFHFKKGSYNLEAVRNLVNRERTNYDRLLP